MQYITSPLKIYAGSYKECFLTLFLWVPMKFISPLLFFFLIATTESMAQHCPFDGLYAIVIRTHHSNQKIMAPMFYLAEKEVSDNDSCSFTNRIDSLGFRTEKMIRADWAEEPHSTRSRYLPEQLRKDFNFLKGNRVVFLSMSQKDCMVPRGNEYDMVPRNFVIRYTYKGGNMEIPITEESIYHLCGTGGSWKRIKPINIQGIH
jgi:hypothetical protein